MLSNIANRSCSESKGQYSVQLGQEARLFKRLIYFVKDDTRAMAQIYAVKACRAATNPLLKEDLEQFAPKRVREQMPLGEAN